LQCFDCVVLRCWTISARYRAEIIMLDNGMAEALVKTIKRDYARVSAKPNAASVLRQLDSWFEHYNTVHPHKALRYRSPHEFRKHIVETTTENAVGAGRRPHDGTMTAEAVGSRPQPPQAVARSASLDTSVTVDNPNNYSLSGLSGATTPAAMIASPWPRIGLNQLPPRLSVAQDGLDLWSLFLGPANRSINALDEFISDEEMTRANRFIYADLRRRYIVAHAGLRLLLSRYVGIAAKALEFETGEQGKPSLAVLQGEIAFNLSHSADLALVAVASSVRLGVDVEQLREITDATEIARSYFSTAEYAALAAVAPADRSRAFLTCWTRKEAFVKALGGGLSVDFAGFAVSLSREQSAFLSMNGLALDVARWSIIHLEPVDGYIGAAAIESPTSRAKFRHLDIGF
jgi:4'-phosphopantetheinyl transferase